MSFDVGDKVVYPHHGAAIIQRRELREVSGADREYLVLHMAFDDLTLRVPVDSIDSVGLRDAKARRVLVSELSFALGVSDEEAGRRLDAAMA